MQTRSRAWGRWVVAGTAVLAIGAFYVTGAGDRLRWESLRDLAEGGQAFVADQPATAIAGYVTLYCVATALSLPIATALSLLGGAVFGRWLGTGLALTSATLGATLAMLLSRYLFRDLVLARFGERLRPFDDGVRRDGAHYLLSLRLFPFFPFFLVNLGMGLTPIRWATFAGVSAVGMAPATFLFVNAGTALAELRSPADVASPTVLGSFALLALTPLALRWLAGRKRVGKTTDVRNESET